MPGYILHLTAAKMLIDQLSDDHKWKNDRTKRNAFYIGNLVPDTVRNKDLTHFRNESCKGHALEYPDLDLFLKKYSHLKEEDSFQGYLFHLYLDRCFLTEYVPTVAAFYDKNGKETELKDEIAYVEIKKSGEKLTWQQYLSDEYYYGDYTRMNTWILNHFQPETDLDLSVQNPGIEEVSYQEVGKILEEIKNFPAVPEEWIDELKVFDAKKLMHFLEEITTVFLERME